MLFEESKMEQKKIFLSNEWAFNPTQKLMILLFSVIPFMVVRDLVLIELSLFGYFLLVLFLLLFFYLIGLAFSKKGLMIKNDKLYHIRIAKGYTLYRKNIDLEERPVVSILQFTKRQKLPFVFVSKPDAEQSFLAYELFVLKERHIKRDKVIFFENEHSAQGAVQFLEENLGLRNEIFSPDFS